MEKEGTKERAKKRTKEKEQGCFVWRFNKESGIRIGIGSRIDTMICLHGGHRAWSHEWLQRAETEPQCGV